MRKEYDVVIIGGGMAGVCAAIASARNGAKTVLIQDRPVLGGNASSEIRMHICGATHHGNRKNSRETGILEEILLENRERNPQHSFSILDTVIWEKVKEEENLELFLNTRVIRVNSEKSRILSVEAQQLTSERNYTFSGKIYMDCTGDGTVAAWAKAIVRQGREGRHEFGEQYAPSEADSLTMGNSLMFHAADMGKKMPFKRPSWAYEYEEEDLAYRGHSDIGSGYWWIELGGTENTIDDAEEIRDELLKTLYGVWDHIKNKGDHGADNYALDWVQFLPGKRESRRIEGDYILKEQDLLEGRIFEDAVAYGGWPMDMHPPQGFHFSGDPTRYLDLENVYTIPYRCFYSKNIENLMMAGRNISASHMAFGSTRVMATCAVGGQAAGTAAAIAVRNLCSPREVGTKWITELQTKLMRDDCYLPGYKNNDKADLARKAISVNCSSEQPDGRAVKVIDGYQRNEHGEIHEWISAGEVAEQPQWIELCLEKAENLGEVHIKFDTDLTDEYETSLSNTIRSQQKEGLPASMVRRYKVKALLRDRTVWEEECENNNQRFCIHKPKIEADTLRVEILETWGAAFAKIFEIRIYG